MESDDTPRLWSPQRIVGVAQESEEWQRVWSIQPPGTYEEEPVSLQAAQDLVQFSSPLRGNDRRRILELFGLNLECPNCGRHGERLYYGPMIMPAELMSPFGGDEFHPGDDVYACTCRVRWFVAEDGGLVVHEPHPIL